MNARIVFFLSLVFTILNIVLTITTHGGFFMMAVIGLMGVMGSASKVWPDVVRPNASINNDHRNNPAYDHLPSNVFWDGD